MRAVCAERNFVKPQVCPNKKYKKMEGSLWRLPAFILMLWFVRADCYCWGAGKNPSFSDAPRVTQVSLDRVKVEWEGLVRQEECADNYVVKYWQRAAPDDYHITEIVPKEQYEVEIEVAPKVTYQYQAVAREEKGVIGGVDWNKSPSVSFKTSTRAEKIRMSGDRGSRRMSTSVTGPEEAAVSAAAADGSTTTATSDKFFGLGLELFVAAVVAGVILVFVLFGIVYRFACGGKSVDDDDDEDDENESEEKEDLNPA